MPGHPKFYKYLEKMKDIHDRKNSNYAEKENPLSNFMECRSFGIDPFKGVLVRMSDKWSRIKRLTNGAQDVCHESIEDTLIDLAVYSLLAICLLDDANSLGCKPGKTYELTTLPKY